MTPYTEQTGALTDELIDHLIGARNRMTDRRDEMIDFRAVDHIDAVLSTVPHRQRPDVDALLGRKSAAKWSSDEDRAAWKAEVEREGAALAAAKMDQYFDWLSRGLPDGMIEHDDLQEGHW